MSSSQSRNALVMAAGCTYIAGGVLAGATAAISWTRNHRPLFDLAVVGIPLGIGVLRRWGRVRPFALLYSLITGAWCAIFIYSLWPPTGSGTQMILGFIIRDVSDWIPFLNAFVGLAISVVQISALMSRRAQTEFSARRHEVEVRKA